LTQCKADDLKKYKRLKSAWIKENLSRILEENPGKDQTANPLLDCWVITKVDTNYVRYWFLTMVLRFKIQVFRDVKLFGGAQCLDLNPENKVTMRLLK